MNRLQGDIIIPHWHAMSMSGSYDDIKHQLALASERREQQGGAPLEYFLPTILMETQTRGKAVLRRTKLLGRYLFLRDSAKAIDSLRQQMPTLHWLRNADGTPCAHIPDDEMQMFITISRHYGNEPPCYPIGSVDLEEGDRVEIVGGEFNGVCGTLRTEQGRDGGRVVLAVGGLFIVTTHAIAPQHIRILSFGHGNRHPYRKFEAHLPRVLDALALRRDGKPLTADLNAALSVFIRRFDSLAPATVNQASWHAALMLASHTALGNTEEARAALQQCEQLLPKLKSTQQRALHLALMWASTSRADLQQQLTALIADWQPITPTDRKKQAILAIAARFAPVN